MDIKQVDGKTFLIGQGLTSFVLELNCEMDCNCRQYASKLIIDGSFDYNFSNNFDIQLKFEEGNPLNVSVDELILQKSNFKDQV